jgi:molybdate transport system substrate-binding protein
MVTITGIAGGAQSDKVIKTLGLADALANRVAHKVGLTGGLAMIASGEATLGIFPKSEIVSVSGIALAGPLPPALQLTLPTAPASLAGAKSPDRRPNSSGSWSSRRAARCGRRADLTSPANKTVMAGLVPAIHVLLRKASRGCPAQGRA